MEKQSILSLLQQTSVSTVGVNSDKIVTVLNSMPITQAFKIIYDHKIHSVPVKDPHSQHFVNMLDLQDVVKHLFASFSDDELEHLHIPQITEWQGQYIQVIGEKDHYADRSQEIPDPKKIQFFASKKVSEVAKGPWVSIPDTKSLKDVVDAIVNCKDRHVHRVSITGKDGQLVRIITQSDILSFLQNNSSQLGEVANMTVGQLNLDKLHSQILKIEKSAVALEGFKLMNEKAVGGIPVVDKEGVLVGNLSMSDMRLIAFNATQFLYLYLATSEYLQKVHQKDSSIPDEEVAVTVNSTLADLLSKFTQNRVHRVYIVDSSHKLVGLITMGDVLRVISKSKL